MSDLEMTEAVGGNAQTLLYLSNILKHLLIWGHRVVKFVPKPLLEDTKGWPHFFFLKEKESRAYLDHSPR